MSVRSALLVVGAGLAAAQCLSGNCSSALLAVAASPDATCLDLALLAPLAVSNATVIPTVNSWLTGMCNEGPCSNATLQTVVTKIITSCSSDLASLGLTTSDPSSVMTTVQAAYPTVRQIACLKDTSANTLCITELLADIQSMTNRLSIKNLVGLITRASAGNDTTIPQNVTCSNCSKAAYTIAAQAFPALVTSNQTTIQSECGSSFTNGQIPSNIKGTASNSTSTSGAPPHVVSSLNVGAALLIAVSFVFTIFG